MLTQQEMDEVKRITAFLKLPEDKQYGSVSADFGKWNRMSNNLAGLSLLI